MKNYVGYGFNVDDITKRELFDFMKKYASDDVEDMIEDLLDTDDETDLTQEESDELISEVEDWVDSHYISKEDYIVAVLDPICSGLFKAYDCGYIVYPFMKFPEDDTEEKRKFVRNAQDVQSLFAKYFPGNKIHFGEIWDGNEWEDLHPEII